MNEDISKYEDIINLPHHVSKKHPQMSIEARAAQFAPFAALVGYEDAVKETARLTGDRIDLDEEIKLMLDYKLQLIQQKINQHPEIEITYFIPDIKKQGGEYTTTQGKLKKVDKIEQTIILIDGRSINIQDVIDINFNMNMGMI